jgi:hypothetical protein
LGDHQTWFRSNNLLWVKAAWSSLSVI